MPSKLTHLKEAINEIRQENSPSPLNSAVPLDETHLFYDNQKVLNFCSPDYLGLSFHTTLQKNAIKFTLQHGHSSTRSAGCLVTMSIQTALLEKLTEAIGVEKASLHPSRFHAHTATLPTLATSQSLILLDRSAHFSLKQAATISRAQVELFTHNDLTHLRLLLEKTKNLSYFTKVIATESIFSTEGDRAPLEELSALAEQYDAILYVDDSQALGPLGKKGMGLTAHKKEIDVRVGAFDQGCGGCLGFVGGSTLIMNYLEQQCPALKENPLPLPALGVVDAILDLLPQLEGERKQLQQRAYFLNTQLQSLGYSTGTSTTHLIPIFLESNKEVLKTYEKLLEKKILVKPLLSPFTVHNHARILLCLSTHHTPEDLSILLNFLNDKKREKAITQEEPCATARS